MNNKTKTIVGIGLFTAIVLVLQFLGGSIKFGMFSISLVLVPIVVGAAVYGWQAGAWLGFVFGVAVLLSGDAAAFLAVDVAGTIVTVLVKGTAAGLCAGLVYRAVLVLLDRYSSSRIQLMKHRYHLGECCQEGVYSYISRNNRYVAVIAAAVICPVVNTGVFLLGCRLFFMETIAGWGAAAGFVNVASYMFIGLAGINFLIELGTNIILAPVITRLISYAKK
ncbi:MAG: ECF transporter S component [Ruminococcaceae bacterium]|nr:ECF transporter S component [Oscillospiraceae bacterium]